jgi:flagellar biogenesis protein FliO
MEFGQQYLAVAAVLGLLGAALWWLRRNGHAAFAARGRAGRQLESLERLPLSPQHSLHLVRVGSSTVLVACSPSGCAVVREMAADAVRGSAA